MCRWIVDGYIHELSIIRARVDAREDVISWESVESRSSEVSRSHAHGGYMSSQEITRVRDFDFEIPGLKIWRMRECAQCCGVVVVCHISTHLHHVRTGKAAFSNLPPIRGFSAHNRGGLLNVSCPINYIFYVYLVPWDIDASRVAGSSFCYQRNHQATE